MWLADITCRSYRSIFDWWVQVDDFASLKWLLVVFLKNNLCYVGEKTNDPLAMYAGDLMTVQYNIPGNTFVLEIF
jgi:hypothetical protein